MERKGINRAELASRLGIGASSVSEWWTQHSIPSGDLILRFPEVLEVGWAELFEEGRNAREPLGVLFQGIGNHERLDLLTMLAEVQVSLAKGRGEADSGGNAGGDLGDGPTLPAAPIQPVTERTETTRALG